MSGCGTCVGMFVCMQVGVHQLLCACMFVYLCRRETFESCL